MSKRKFSVLYSQQSTLQPHLASCVLSRQSLPCRKALQLSFTLHTAELLPWQQLPTYSAQCGALTSFICTVQWLYNSLCAVHCSLSLVCTVQGWPDKAKLIQMANCHAGQLHTLDIVHHFCLFLWKECMYCLRFKYFTK